MCRWVNGRASALDLGRFTLLDFRIQVDLTVCKCVQPCGRVAVHVGWHMKEYPEPWSFLLAGFPRHGFMFRVGRPSRRCVIGPAQQTGQNSDCPANGDVAHPRRRSPQSPRVDSDPALGRAHADSHSPHRQVSAWAMSASREIHRFQHQGDGECELPRDTSRRTYARLL